MKQRLGERFRPGAGATTTPTSSPALQKVVQAAGRVIRTPDDRGVVVPDRRPLRLGQGARGCCQAGGGSSTIGTDPPIYSGV